VGDWSSDVCSSDLIMCKVVLRIMATDECLSPNIQTFA
jgi:hypothetical protein